MAQTLVRTTQRTCHLPAGYLDASGDQHRQAELRALTGREEEILTQSDPVSAVLVTEVLSRCVKRIGSIEPVSPSIIRELLVGDRQYLLLMLRQLTFGGQNAEAYWAPDGKRLVFQSTRDGVECDQIFVMNDDGSDQRMVSTGKGRTTCGYFLADNKHIVYASTHERDAKCPPAADRSKGYVWAVYPGYDIFLAAEDGKIEKKLTEADGYDAEATVNWKTKKIVYTSMASGDLEMWTMNSDGSGKKQVTKGEGYDGGAVFSRDGKKLVWRANHPAPGPALDRYRELIKENLTTPMKMEIFIADANGANA